MFAKRSPLPVTRMQPPATAIPIVSVERRLSRRSGCPIVAVDAHNWTGYGECSDPK